MRMLLLILFSMVLCNSVSAESDPWKNCFFIIPPVPENKGHNETPISPTQYEDSVAGYESGEYDRAYSLLLPLAEKGNPKAELRLGRMCLYLNGCLVTPLAPPTGNETGCRPFYPHPQIASFFLVRHRRRRPQVMKLFSVCDKVSASAAGGEIGVFLVQRSPLLSWIGDFRAPLSLPRAAATPEHVF